MSDSEVIKGCFIAWMLWDLEERSPEKGSWKEVPIPNGTIATVVKYCDPQG